MTGVGIIVIIMGLVWAVTNVPKAGTRTIEGNSASVKVFAGLLIAYFAFSIMQGWVR
jgi:hypothetical protein